MSIAVLRQIALSLPSRERGLKLRSIARAVFLLMSLPSRERGLKSLVCCCTLLLLYVAPFAGAWIEIVYFDFLDGAETTSLPSRERGLKLLTPTLPLGVVRRSLRGSVD